MRDYLEKHADVADEIEAKLRTLMMHKPGEEPKAPAEPAAVPAVPAEPISAGKAKANIDIILED